MRRPSFYRFRQVSCTVFESRSADDRQCGHPVVLDAPANRRRRGKSPRCKSRKRVVPWPGRSNLPILRLRHRRNCVHGRNRQSCLGVAALTASHGEDAPDAPYPPRTPTLATTSAIPRRRSTPSRPVRGQGGHPALPSPRRIPRIAKARSPAGRPEPEGSISRVLVPFRRMSQFKGRHISTSASSCRLRSPRIACASHPLCFPAQRQAPKLQWRVAIRCRDLISGQCSRPLPGASQRGRVLQHQQRRRPKMTTLLRGLQLLRQRFDLGGIAGGSGCADLDLGLRVRASAFQSKM